MSKKNHRIYRVFGIYPGMPTTICGTYKEAVKETLKLSEEYDQPFILQTLEELKYREIDWRRFRKNDKI